jgi:hypothetical protein
MDGSSRTFRGWKAAFVQEISLLMHRVKKDFIPAPLYLLG